MIVIIANMYCYLKKKVHLSFVQYVLILLQKSAIFGFLLIIIQSRWQFLLVWVVKLIKESIVNHLLLPWNRHCSCTEFLKKLLIIGIKFNPFNLREVPDITCVFSVHNIGFGHPWRWNKPRLQPRDVDGFEELMFPRVTPMGKKQFTVRNMAYLDKCMVMALSLPTIILAKILKH